MTKEEKRVLLSLRDMHLRFLEAVKLTECADLDLTLKPLVVPRSRSGAASLRIYMFNCTQHDSERKSGDYRIQLRLPGQQRRSRGQLETDGGSVTLLVGYVPEFEVFVLWDAYAHADFPYSKGVQVAGSTIHQAAIHGRHEQSRRVRGLGYTEVVIAARADRLLDGLELRRRRTRESLVAMEIRSPDRG